MSAAANHISPQSAKVERAALVVLLAGLGVGLVFGWRELWASPWYRWFPVALVAAALLGWRGWRDAHDLPGRVAPGASAATWSLFGLGFLLLAGAACGWPLLALWALPVVLAGIVWSRGGWDWLQEFVPALVMLLAIAPPPLRVDIILVERAGRWVLGGADRLLTALGVPHLREGSGFELAGLAIPTSDLLAGWHGMAGVAGLTLALLLALRRPAWRIAVVLAAQAVVVVPVGMAQVVWGLWQSDMLGANFFLSSRAEVIMVGL